MKKSSCINNSKKSSCINNSNPIIQTYKTFIVNKQSMKVRNEEIQVERKIERTKKEKKRKKDKKKKGKEKKGRKKVKKK